jgi:hypothetical protein
MSSATGLRKLFRGQAERGSGVGLKLFGFIAESAFTVIPESWFGFTPEHLSESSRNCVHLDRIPHHPFATVAPRISLHNVLPGLRMTRSQ